MYDMNNGNTIPMTCVNNSDYEDCLTIGKVYLVKEIDGMQQLIDDNGEWLQTALRRFQSCK